MLETTMLLLLKRNCSSFYFVDKESNSRQLIVIDGRNKSIKPLQCSSFIYFKSDFCSILIPFFFYCKI